MPEDRIIFLRRWRDTPRGPAAILYDFGDTDRVPQQPFKPDADEGIATVQLANAILLTHGCELDNRPGGNVLFALVRPMRTVPEEHREAIRGGRNISFLPLEDNDDPPLEESYVDFSRISSMKPEALPRVRRILSASPELLKALYLGIARYFTRFEIRPEELAGLVEQAGAETPNN